MTRLGLVFWVEEGFGRLGLASWAQVGKYVAGYVCLEGVEEIEVAFVELGVVF